ncbi:MAG TPA: glycosyltransferase family 2 protein [Gaiellaceae bacterium]|nr:glycosyltransferase family 2 protein [Gaiellaceae bacterium]
MSTARIAVLMPCFDEGDLLLESVASVREQEPVEILVIDDASSNSRTLELLERLEGEGVTVLRQPSNAGPGAARTAGLHATRAEYVFSLDADDLVEPGMLARMATLLDGRPEAGVAYGDHQEFGDGEVLRRAPERIDPFRLLYVFEYPPAALFRRSVLERLGGWEAEGIRLPAYEDWHLWLKLAEHGVQGVHVGPGVITYRRRLHGDRLLTRARKQHRSLYRTLRRLHPALFAQVGQHRRASDLSTRRKLLYPIVYGGRPKFSFEHRIRVALERHGLRISGGP